MFPILQHAHIEAGAARHYTPRRSLLMEFLANAADPCYVFFGRYRFGKIQVNAGVRPNMTVRVFPNAWDYNINDTVATPAEMRREIEDRIREDFYAATGVRN